MQNKTVPAARTGGVDKITKSWIGLISSLQDNNYIIHIFDADRNLPSFPSNNFDFCLVLEKVSLYILLSVLGTKN